MDGRSNVVLCLYMFHISLTLYIYVEDLPPCFTQEQKEEIYSESNYSIDVSHYWIIVDKSAHFYNHNFYGEISVLPRKISKL